MGTTKMKWIAGVALVLFCLAAVTWFTRVELRRFMGKLLITAGPVGTELNIQEAVNSRLSPRGAVLKFLRHATNKEDYSMFVSEIPPDFPLCRPGMSEDECRQTNSPPPEVVINGRRGVMLPLPSSIPMFPDELSQELANGAARIKVVEYRANDSEAVVLARLERDKPGRELVYVDFYLTKKSGSWRICEVAVVDTYFDWALPRKKMLEV